MEMVLLITVREAVSLLHRTPARFTSSLRKYVTKKPKQAPCVVSVSAFSNNTERSVFGTLLPYMCPQQ